MKYLRVLLLPFVPVYAAVVAIRNMFFDKNILKSKKVHAKVISVGNLTVGGSGKTPAVIYLTNLLESEGRKVGVLSRGYGRKSVGYKLVSDGKEIFTTVRECGDEMYHTVLDCSVPAAVSERRVYGAERLIKKTGINTIVLDDAFQHRWIARDIDLLIFEQRFLREGGFFEKNLLPVGYLREPLSQFRRADAIILNRKFSEKKYVPLNFGNKPVFTAHYSALYFIDLLRKTKYEISEFHGQKSLVVSGVANPYSFLNVLGQTKVDTSNRLIFRDHKNYTNKDVQKIRKEFYTTNSHSVVTTEKDAVKLTHFLKELDDIDIFYLKIELVMDDEESFKKFMLNKLS